MTDEQVETQRRLADELRADPDLLERTVAEAIRKLATIPIQSKGVKAVRREPGRAMTWVVHTLGRLGRKFALRSGR